MKESHEVNPVLSIIVLNYNAGNFLVNCLKSIYDSKLNCLIEIIIVDNNSSDDSIALVKNLKLQNNRINPIKFLLLKNNKGFSYGNNQGLSISNKNSKYVLFLNPDTTVENTTICGMVDYFQKHSEIDAATCDVILATSNQTQPESHRGFPTPWNSFWHFFGLNLPKAFPKSKLLNGYYLGYLDYSKPQIIDVCVGAFVMIKREVGDICNWWNEKYFMYGEDIDLGYQIKQHGFKLYFIPKYKITHFQGVSSGIKKTNSKANRETKIRSAIATTNAMRIFYQTNLIQKYPKFLQSVVWTGINILETYRVFKAKYL